MGMRGRKEGMNTRHYSVYQKNELERNGLKKGIKLENQRKGGERGKRTK
jgi:hypothetical protein